MTPSASLVVGFSCGIALGWLSGRDLAASAARSSSSLHAALGLARRGGYLASGLSLSLVLGPKAWLGVAAGYLGAFAASVGREALARGR